MYKLILDTVREGYGTDEVGYTMTVGKLISFLENYPEDTPIYLGFDSRRTYGGINPIRFQYGVHIGDDENDDDDDDDMYWG